MDLVAVLGDEFNVDLTITFNMTAPPGLVNTGAQPIHIQETFTIIPPTNGPDILNLPDLSGLVLTLGPLTIDNFLYSGSGISGLVWTLAENTTGSINILADFSAEEVNGTPEPATLALVGSGLIGLGYAMRRRRKAIDVH